MASTLSYQAWCGYGLSNRMFPTFSSCKNSTAHILAVLSSSPSLKSTSPPTPKPSKRFAHLTPLLSQLSSPSVDIAVLLEPWLHRLTAEEWNVLVADVGLQNWTNALQVFNVFTQKSPLWLDLLHQNDNAIVDGTQSPPTILKLFTSLVKVLSRKQRISEICAIQERMKEVKIVPDVSFFNAMFTSYADNGQVANISEGLLYMEAARIKPDKLSYESLITAYLHGETKELGKCASILEDMIQEGVPVSAKTCGKLMNAFWEAEDVDGAERVFAAMRDAGYLPDLKVIVKLMQLHGRKGNHKRNRELFSMLKKFGIEQTDAAYNFLLHAYCKAGLLNQARKTFENFQRVTGSKPSLVAYNMIIDACGKQGLHEEAFQYYANLCSSGLEPTVVSYCSIILAMVKVGRFKKAEQLFKRMLAKGLQPNSHIYVTMIHCFTTCKATRSGHELYLAMKSLHFKMTDTAYSTVLALYIKGKWYGHAAAILKHIEREGFKLDTAAHGLLIRAFMTLDDAVAPLAQAVEASRFNVCKLLTSLALTSRGSPRMDSNAHNTLVGFLESLEDGKEEASILSMYDAFVDCFWERGLRQTAQFILGKARKANTRPQMHGTEWILDVRGLSVGGSKVAVVEWINSVDELATEGTTNGTTMIIVTGGGDFFPQVVETKDPESQSKGLKGALLSMLQDHKSPFMESPHNPTKLQASAADVLEWVSRGTVKQDMNLINCC